MKRFLFFVLLVTTTMLANGQNIVDSIWNNTVVEALSGKQYLSFNVSREEYAVFVNGTTSDTIRRDIVFQITPRAIYQDDGFRRTKLTVDSLFLNYYHDGNFSYGRIQNLTTEREQNRISLMFANLFSSVEQYAPFYINLQVASEMRLPFSSYSWDNATKCHIFEYTESGHGQSAYGQAAVLTDTVRYRVCKESKLVTDIMIIQQAPYGTKVTSYRFSNISFEVPNIDERQYCIPPAGYDTYNINTGDDNPSESSVFIYHEELQKLLDAPIVSLNHDTVTLNEVEGWVLVELWSFGCRPCAKFHKRIQEELAESGARSLEAMRVSVMCINPYATLTDALVEYAARFDIGDITYSGKSLNALINIDAVPLYILISPQKEIVYRGNDLGEDYSVVVEKMKQWECRWSE